MVWVYSGDIPENSATTILTKLRWLCD